MAAHRRLHLASTCNVDSFLQTRPLHNQLSFSPLTITALSQPFASSSIPPLLAVKKNPFYIRLGCADQVRVARSSQIIAKLLQPPALTRSFWMPFFPRPFKYSSNYSDIDPIQLSDLWERTLKVSRDPKKIMKALHHSYAFVVVLTGEDTSTYSRSSKKIIGVGRAVSDGAFVATICDVAMDPEYQRLGIGRRIVKSLMQDMRSKGGPTGFAVFPPPSARRFFWMMGFRSDKKYRFMVYKGISRQSISQSLN